ncbi:MAG: prephenate dehydratase [Gammaproteobacteria bacterium]|nr:prephenate dehydratase [Gammaproteobacteria bacterium]
MIKIGVQGAIGSFSEQAAHSFAERKGIEQFEVKYLISSANVIAGVNDHSVDYGIFAMENAQGGVVIESVEAMAEYRFKIIDMYYVMVIQNLLTLPGTQLSDITSIHSHQQALRQCRNYLADNFWSCPLIEEDDTAEAARRLSEGKLKKTAAVIANDSCAELYKLHISQDNIQDLKNNLTMFLAVSAYDKN